MEELEIEICAEMLRRMIVEEYARSETIQCGVHISGRCVSAVEAVGFLIIHQLKMSEERSEKGYSQHLLAVDPQDFEAYLAQNWDQDVISFEEIMVVFFTYCIIQNGSLPSTRQPFLPLLSYYKLLKLFSMIGYVAELNGQFLWTDEIGPIMQRCSIWNDAFECSLETEKQEFEKSVDLAYHSTPEFIRKVLLNAKKEVNKRGTSYFHYAVQQYWNGYEWTDPNSDSSWIKNDAWYQTTEYFEFCDALMRRF